MGGIGSVECLGAVPVDSEGRLVPSALSALIRRARLEGKTPLYVNATAGTTVYGAFDPLDEIAAYLPSGVALDAVDASWGGPLIFSRHHRHKLTGVHRGQFDHGEPTQNDERSSFLPPSYSPRCRPIP